MKRITLGELDAVVTGGPDREGGGDGPMVVLLHGFGAPGDDLVPLWRVLDVPAETRFVFPAAPISFSMGMGESRAWWMIDPSYFADLAEGPSSRPDRSDEIPEGLVEARAKLSAFLDALERAFAPPRLVLGGFSQGAMLSLDVALHRARPLSGLVLMSGTLLSKSEWTPRMKERRGLPVLQSHGKEDPLLAFSQAEALRDLMSREGLSVEWVPFRGGHQIPDVVLDRLGAFIARVAFSAAGG